MSSQIFPGFPRTFNGQPLASLPGDWVWSVLYQVSRTGFIGHLHQVLDAGLDVKSQDTVLWCLAKVEEVEPENHARRDHLMEMAATLVEAGASIRGLHNEGDSQQENVLHLLVEASHTESGYGYSVSHLDARLILGLIHAHAPTGDIAPLLVQTKGHGRGRTPLELAFERFADPVIPALLALHHRCDHPIPWTRVFEWFSTLEKVALMGHKNLSLDNILDQFEAMGAPVEGADGVPALASFVNPGSEVDVVLVQREKARLETRVDAQAASLASGSRLRL